MVSHCDGGSIAVRSRTTTNGTTTAVGRAVRNYLGIQFRRYSNFETVECIGVGFVKDISATVFVDGGFL